MPWGYLGMDLGERAAPDQKEKKHRERQNPIENSHVLLPRLPQTAVDILNRFVVWVSTDAGGLRLSVMRANPALRQAACQSNLLDCYDLKSSGIRTF